MHNLRRGNSTGTNPNNILPGGADVNKGPRDKVIALGAFRLTLNPEPHHDTGFAD